LSGSPALTSSRSEVRHAARSCWMSIRHTVGGAQNVVTCASRNTPSIAAASNRS
jgi:hypothetical protein